MLAQLLCVKLKKKLPGKFWVFMDPEEAAVEILVLWRVPGKV